MYHNAIRVWHTLVFLLIGVAYAGKVKTMQSRLVFLAPFSLPRCVLDANFTFMEDEGHLSTPWHEWARLGCVLFQPLSFDRNKLGSLVGWGHGRGAPSITGSITSGTPSNAFEVRCRLNFHYKSKFQIQAGKISWSVLWKGGGGPSFLFKFQLQWLFWVQKEWC